MRLLRNVFAMALVCLCFTFATAQNTEKIDTRILDAFSGKMAKQDNREGVRVIVHLEDKDDVNERTTIVMDTVAASVLKAQNKFMADLRDLDMLDEGLPRKRGTRIGFQPEVLLDYQYAVAGYVHDMGTLNRLAERPDVVSLEYDKLNKLFTVEGRQMTGSDTVAAAGYGGQGTGVAVIDSNFDLLHSELGGSTSLPNGVVYGGYNYSSNNNSIHSQNFNDCYHGTGTASIVRRYAPSAHLYTLVVFPNAYDSVIANAINWCVTNKNGANGGNPIKVINMSLGGGQYSGTCNTGLIHSAAGTALSNGILVAAATGNDGWTSSIASPACSSNVIAIGSVWDENGAAYSPFPPAYCSDSNRLADERTCYSNKSPQVDLYAPSEEVICARCGGGTFALGGTSSACPAAAGMFAQLISYDSSYAGNKSGVVSHLASTGVSVTGDSGKYRIDLANATGGGSGGGGGGSTGGALTSGVAESVADTGTGTMLQFYIDVPANASDLTVTISGGTGDADLYVRRGSQPTTSTYDCRPYLNGNNESCQFSNPAADRWYIGIRAYAAFTGLSVTATVTGGGGGTCGGSDSLSNLSANSGSWLRYTGTVDACATSLEVAISGGSGDADLYVRYGSQPTTSSYDCRPYKWGNEETCTINNPTAGTWHYGIRAYNTFSGLTLTEDIQ